jgi:hypothetical protein
MQLFSLLLNSDTEISPSYDRLGGNYSRLQVYEVH